MTEIEAVEPLPFIDGIVYGEGPRWHNGRLWFTDGPAGNVYSAGEAGDLAVEAEVAHASGLGWLPDGTLVVSTLFDTKVHHVDIRGHVLRPRFDLSELANSTNDLVVAPDGRAYVDLYQATGGRNRLHRLQRRGTGRRHPGSRCRTALAFLPGRDRPSSSARRAGRGSSRSRPNPTAASAPRACSPISARTPPRRSLCRRRRRGVGRLRRHRRISPGRRGWRCDSPRRDRPWMGDRARPRRSRRAHSVHGD